MRLYIKCIHSKALLKLANTEMKALRNTLSDNGVGVGGMKACEIAHIDSMRLLGVMVDCDVFEARALPSRTCDIIVQLMPKMR